MIQQGAVNGRSRQRANQRGTVNQGSEQGAEWLSQSWVQIVLSVTKVNEQGTAAPMTTTNSEGLMSLLWLLIWQESNQNDNTKDESALMKWFKTK